MEKTIDEQLAGLRSTLQRQRGLNFVTVLIAVVALCVSYMRLAGVNATFDTVNCKTWNVIDDNGTARITATTSADGASAMAWLGKDGMPRIGASTSADGNGGISLFGNDGKPRIGATIAADGNAGMTLFDKDMNLRMSAGTFANGNAGMTWFDKDGNSRITASTAADSTVTLPTTDLKLKP